MKKLSYLIPLLLVLSLLFISVSATPAHAAATTIASDNFESGGWSGGSGWADTWYHDGSTSITTSGTAHGGSYHMRLAGRDSWVNRPVNLSGKTNVHVQFWAKATDFDDEDDSADLMVDDGSQYVVHTWYDGDDDGIYRFYDIDLSSYTMSSEFYIIFRIDWSTDTADYFYVDDLAVVSITAPTVTNSTGASSVTHNSARLNGNVTDTGGSNPTVHVYWGDNDGGTTAGNWDTDVNLGAKAAGTFYQDISSLSPGTTYYYRCYATNSAGGDWADSTAEFTTLDTPTVTNSTGASSITQTSARLNGEVTDTGGEDPTVYIYWGDNDGVTTSGNWDNEENLGTKTAETFYQDISSLTPNTTYYYRCYATNSAGGDWADSSATFNTKAQPTIEFTSAISDGNESVTPVNLELSLSEVSSQDITVDYEATGGTATGGGVDYTLAIGTANITAGATTTDIVVTIVNDGVEEDDETIIVTISNPNNATLGANTTHTYTINNDDDNTSPTFSIQYYSDSDLTTSMGDNPKLKAGTYYIKITASEALSAAPTISIDAEGSANDVTDDTTTLVSGNDYKYTRAISSDAAAVGAVLENISISGTDAASNPATNVDPTNEAAKAAYTDTTAPTVTIEQAAEQVDPTSASPINFTVVFSESVSDFIAGDVTLGGTAGATTANVTGSGTTYNVAVSGMSGNGTVTASIDADKAHDAAGNPNTASTSTDNEVTLNITGPTVTNSTGASSIDQTSARLNGEVTSNGGLNPTVYIYWGDNDGGTTTGDWDDNVNLGTKGVETFFEDISGLTAGTTYYYRCYAENAFGSDWANATAQFTTIGAPTVITVEPTGGPVAGGTTITITGTNFVDVSAVTIGGASANFSATNTSHISAITPAGTAGSANVTVTTPGGSATLTDGFTYLEAPTVSSVTPSFGSIAGGTSITITGTNFFSDNTTVTIDSASATSVVVTSATTLTAVTPAGTMGNADVTVITPGGSDTKSPGFTYVLEAPTVTSVSPSSGSSDGGTEITITGTNFFSGATVTIGGTSADNVTVVDFTTITAITPAGTVGAQDVTVTTGGGADTLEDGFTYTQAPSVTNLGPAAYVNGSFSSDTTPTFTFTQSDPNSGDTVKYQIQIDDTANFPSPVVDYTSALLAQGETSFTVSENQTLVTGNYYWRVRPTDNNDNQGEWTVANGGSVAFRIDQNSSTETTTSGNVTVTNTNAAASVIKSGNGAPTITISKYTSNPGGNAPSGFSAAGSYIDVHADNVTDVDEIEIKHYYTDAEIEGLVESSLKMYYQSGTTWTKCSDTGVNTAAVTVDSTAYSGYVWANIRSDTTPDLDYLLGSSFCGIGQAASGGGNGTPGGGGSPVGGGGGGGGGGSSSPPPLTLNQLTTTARLTLDNSGIINTTARLKTPSGKASLYIAKGTKLLDSAGQPLTSLSASAVTSSPAPPSGRAMVSAYDFGADGATFAPTITLTMSYDPTALPEGASETELYIAYWNGSQWVALDTTVDNNNHTLSAEVSHFTLFAILAKLPTTPEAYFEISNLAISPSQIGIGEEIIISAQVANTGGMSGEYTLTMNVEGLPEASQMVELSPGQSQEVSFTVTLDNPGSYQVEIGGLQGSFVVLAGAAGGFGWSLWLIIVITTIVLAAVAFILITNRQQLAPVFAGEKSPKILVKKFPALSRVPARLGKMMAAVATLVKERVQPTTKTIATLVKERLQPTPTAKAETPTAKAERPVPDTVKELLETTPTTVTVKASVSGGHGSVNPIAQTVNSGARATITITPDTGHQIGSITDNGDAAAIANPYVISKVTADHKVVVTFVTDTFTINASAASGGSISPSGAVTVKRGNDQDFTITPNAGHHVADVLVDGASVGAVTSYTFKKVTDKHTISASFAIDTFTIDAKVSGNYGSVSPDTQTVDYGTSAVINITPEARCHIASITDNGSPASIANPYIIPNVTADHKVAVTFVTDVKGLKIIPQQVKPGGVVNVFAEVTNNDPTTTTFSLVLKVRGIVEAVKEITLEPGQSQKVAFVTLRNKPGVYDIDLEGLKGSFTVGNGSATETPVVEEPVEPTPEVSLADVKGLKIIPQQVKPGGVVNVFAEVTNNDPTTTTFSLVLKVRGIVEAVKEITLEPGQSQKVAFVTLRNKPGVYDIDLEGLKGSFTVER